MDAAERGVAVLHRRHDDADGDEVEDVVELEALDDHLLVDAPEVFAAAGDLGVDVQFGETLTHLGDRLGQVDVSFGRAHADEVVEFGEPLRVQRGERQILELLLQLLHPEPVRQRRVDVERLLGDALLLLERHRRDRAHVVQTVGELDDQDPEVLRHRDEHLAHRRRLLLLAAVEADPFELRDTVDDRRDLRRRSRARRRRR